MATDSSGVRGSGVNRTDELTDFLSLLNELKATGCNLLVVGDARPELFTRASASLLGDPTAVRYRLLGITDASIRSIADRLPDADQSPRPLAETTKIVNHAATPRSVTTGSQPSTSADLAGIPEIQVTNPDPEGLQSALVDSIDEFERRTSNLRPSELRVGIDSLGTLLDYHEEDAVHRCFRRIGDCVRAHDAMAHYLLKEPLDSDIVQAFADDVDAIIQIRSVNPETYGHDAQQRWHVPSSDMAMDWIRL